MEQLSLRDRLSAFTNIPRFLKLVYKTSPLLTISNFFIRLILALLPVAMLYVGKLIIDEVVMVTHSGNQVVSHVKLWEYVAVECFLVVLMNALNRLINLVDTLLGELFSNASSISIMSHAAKLDLDQFEDSVFYDKLERARLNLLAGRYFYHKC